MAKAEFHERTRAAGANMVLYWICRPPLELALKLYWRISKLGRIYIPASGPVIIASNHRSFFDPWVVGTMARRPMYYVAKSELFRHPFVAWVLSSLGAFPVARGQGDAEMIRTARELLSRGEIVLIFPEGTRTRPGPLGTPRRGVGRLALESGAPVVPVAIIGTERIRRGFWLAPDKITVRAGAPLHFPATEDPSREEAGAVTEQVWAQVEQQWRSLGGAPSGDGELLHEAARAA